MKVKIFDSLKVLVKKESEISLTKKESKNP